MAEDLGSETIENAETTVFFSYSRKDLEIALPIIREIEAAGYRVWWDGMLDGGTSFLETTEHALETAKAVVVLWSKHSIKSHWVRDEATSGRVSDRLIPLSIDAVEAPLGFRQIQLIDFDSWAHDTNSFAFKSLLRGLKIQHEEDSSTSAVADIKKPRFRPLTRRAVFIGVGSLGVGALAGIAIHRRIESGIQIADNSIAVLPFENLSPENNNAHVAQGLSIEVRNELSRNSALKVVARSSSIAATKENLSAPELAKRLGVSSLLEGTVSIAGDALRVTASLIEKDGGFAKWVRDYSSAIDESLYIKESIIEAVLSSFEAIGNVAGAVNGITSNPAAFHAYLKGDALYRAYESRESLFEALNFFDTALALDPSFGMAMAVKAQLEMTLGAGSSDKSESERLLKNALRTAEQAVEVSPNLAEAHSALGYIRMGAFLDIAGAEEPYKKSVELSPGDSGILARYAIFMAVIGEHIKAQASIRQALTLDPLNVTIHNSAGLIFYAGGRYDEAINRYERVLDMSPNFYNAQARIGLSLIQKQDYSGAVTACTKERNLLEKHTCLAIAHHHLGQTELADKSFKDLLETYGDAGAYQQVQVLSEWGQLEQAMDSMRLSVKLNDSGLGFAGFDPALNNLRGRTDFKQILADLGYKV